jgi:hypothetical protein
VALRVIGKGIVQPTLEKARCSYRAARAAGCLKSGLAWLKALIQNPQAAPPEGFVLTIWPTCRDPWRPAVSDLAVAPSSMPGSPKSKACPSRPRRTSPRHILGPAPLRAFYSVPNGVGVRADHTVPCPATKRAAVLLIETDSKSLIGTMDRNAKP